ncbi:MAG: hypothetical protein WA979_00730 [Pacificimonas sp.]
MLIEARRFVRRNLERIGGATAFALPFVFRSDLAAKFQSEAWNLAAFYAAIFDWSSIQSAFLFGIYAFVLSRSEPFIRAISDNSVFEELRTYVRRALYLTLALTLITIPLVVSSPSPDPSWTDYGLWIVAIITAFTAYTFLSFIKVLRVFAKIERLRRTK